MRLDEHREASGGTVPKSIFNHGLRHGISPFVAEEIVALNPKAKTVLLLERPGKEEDPYFFEKMALPGSVLRQGETESDALNRALGEFGGVALHEPIFVDKMLCSTPRGDELALVHRVFVDPKKCILARSRDGFYSPDDLPDNTLGFHVDMIKMVVFRLQW
ncbi:MAG TPA: hypothetical protein VJK53_03685 [Candidatus Paceibacterota bacterium]